MITCEQLMHPKHLLIIHYEKFTPPMLLNEERFSSKLA